jgi:hypothetical protein
MNTWDRDRWPTRAEAEADERGWEPTECPDCGEVAVDPDGVCQACEAVRGVLSEERSQGDAGVD